MAVACAFCGGPHVWWDCRKKPDGWKPAKAPVDNQSQAKASAGNGVTVEVRELSRQNLRTDVSGDVSRSSASDGTGAPISNGLAGPAYARDDGVANTKPAHNSEPGPAPEASDERDTGPSPLVVTPSRQAETRLRSDSQPRGDEALAPIKRKDARKGDRHRAGYQAEYMREYRAKKAAKADGGKNGHK